MSKDVGIVILFGSGETLDSGRKIQRNVLMTLPRNQHVAILETPAGFQPNSAAVAQELAEVFRQSLQEFVTDVTVVPARKKGTVYSPDDEDIIAPLEQASYIILGPGSPTYAATQLQNSKALESLKRRWEQGATLVLSSAAAIASGEFVLPVYEIYKAGHDLCWEKGLRLFSDIGLPFSVVTHWDNTDGGEKLDTSHCFMGEKRFMRLYELFPKDKPLLCIDEHTAAIFYFSQDVFSVEGKGTLTLLLENRPTTFDHGKTYSISAIVNGEKKEVVLKRLQEKSVKEIAYTRDIPDDVLVLLEKRKQAKEEKDFITADSIRDEVISHGYTVEDIAGEQKDGDQDESISKRGISIVKNSSEF